MDKGLQHIMAFDLPYRIRMMGCIAIAELLVLGFVTLWPIYGIQISNRDLRFSEHEISMEDVQITRQESSPPPPPKPRIPIPVPNDEVVEEKIPDLQEIDFSRHTDPLSKKGIASLGKSDQITSNPQKPPSVVKIVEPTVPKEAKRAGVKAEIWVNFLVDKQGNVEEAVIKEIRLFDNKGDEYEVVDQIGHGIPQATIEAALQWKFHPAKDNGTPVKAYTTQIFTYGF